MAVLAGCLGVWVLSLPCVSDFAGLVQVRAVAIQSSKTQSRYSILGCQIPTENRPWGLFQIQGIAIALNCGDTSRRDRLHK
ncbi:hypothetical protein BO86DRAFT_384956 [Aspergillus japonicus CBS 114.51]|uniref:Secreted protein n=1 Tax=Aspergillus japonicus CBS 114.51 TaxID=1448312 RepID=A0A8T8XGR1_ASPJA|nr:hypothetical protein BO86DRAFT_384956 [Aspergillus japonicus CBS 114.51]RAH86974.1 hypothetical protein BO86DRAFT_384956 [Aspergillus japonicus CBS 114.51]